MCISPDQTSHAGRGAGRRAKQLVTTHTVRQVDGDAFPDVMVVFLETDGASSTLNNTRRQRQATLLFQHSTIPQGQVKQHCSLNTELHHKAK